MMKRNKVIVVALCLMMILTAGAGAVSAKQDENPRQAGNSSRYFYDVQATDSDASGRLMIDLDKHTFLFNGKGFTDSMYYSLHARAEGSTDYAFFASGKATPSGNLRIAGMWEPGVPFPAEVAATTGVPAVSGVQAVYGFYLNNYGWFVAKIASYYSTDNGVSWKESGHTDGITKGNRKWVNLEDLGVPYGALVKIHVIVVAGKDRTDSRIYQYYVPDFYDPLYWEHPYCYADYDIKGTTGNPELTWFNYQCQNVPD